MIDPDQFRTEIIAPTLHAMDMYSLTAQELLLGTALVESGLTYLRQHNNGPAVGVYQMEPATARDITDRYFAHRPAIERRMEKAVYLLSGANIDWPAASDDDLSTRIVSDLRLATALTRLRYWMVPEMLPLPGDIEGYAKYWKRHYNTYLGAGTPGKFTRAYSKHSLRPA